MEADNKRKTRTYKATDTQYNKAMRRAKKEKGTLTNLVEHIIMAYAAGLKIQAYNANGEGIRIKPVKS